MCVVQRYLQDPYIIDGLKFDFRIYVLVFGVDPLRIFLYNEGLVRFATVEYEQPSRHNMNNLYMHLTNYAINKLNDDFVQNEDECYDDEGHKRSLTAIMRQLKDEGVDTDKLMFQIKEIIRKTIIAAQPSLVHLYRSSQPDDLENSLCFEILGFDVMVDADHKPWLIEINHAPSFATESPLDLKVKQGLTEDTFKLLNMTVKKKYKYKMEKYNQM